MQCWHYVRPWPRERASRYLQWTNFRFGLCRSLIVMFNFFSVACADYCALGVMWLCVCTRNVCNRQSDAYRTKMGRIFLSDRKSRDRQAGERAGITSRSQTIIKMRWWLERGRQCRARTPKSFAQWIVRYKFYTWVAYAIISILIFYWRESFLYPLFTACAPSANIRIQIAVYVYRRPHKRK